MKRRSILGLTGALVATVVLTGSAAVPASAADGNFVTNGDFSEGVALDASSTTDFTWTDSTFKPYGTPGMYDPGMYTIASNPSAVHEAWANFGDADPMMIVNGFETENQLVWAQDVDLTGATPTSTHTLWAGQNQNVGTITVTPEADGTFCVKYDLSDAAVADGWLINQIHIATAAKKNGIPQNKNGVPQPGQFPVNESYSPGVTEQEICDVAAGDVIAAHAALTKVVNGTVVKTDTGWSEGPRFVGTNWSMYSEYKPVMDFRFSMNATNVLRPGFVPGEAGAHLSVTLNGVLVGETDLTGVNPGNLVTFEKTIPYTETVEIEVRNLATDFWGNDFAIDDISLVQVS